MNAHEMFCALLEHEKCEGLDEWIKTTLFERMKQSIGMSTNYNTTEIKWPSRDFIHAMRELGYTVDLKCDDRPCALPYYKISINITQPGR